MRKDKARRQAVFPVEREESLMKNMRAKKYKRVLSGILLAGLLFSGCGTKEQTPAEPTKVTVWNYYNGQQMQAFEELVSQFNKTVGKEKGIIVESHSFGTVNDLEENVLNSVNHKVGASELPSIFAAYADTAYRVDQMGYATDLRPYLTEKEQEKFIDSYLEEGDFLGDGSLKIFPIAKSIEILMLNRTDWDKFAEATGASQDALQTIEGITQTAQSYYEWTDSLTEEPDDGKAFFGRDAMANYFLIGAKQQGVEIFSIQDGQVVLNFDKAVVRKLWDNYYIPFVKGYFAVSGRFRSDDIQTGNIVAFVGSSSGATFFPDKVILSDTESYDIEMKAMESPGFAEGEKIAVQQGAGMVVTNTDEAQIQAAVTFLKWFTEDERNIEFSLASGYLPVTKTANDLDKMKQYLSGEEESTLAIEEVALDTVNHNTLYTTKAFQNGTSARNILEYSMTDKATADRKTVEERLSAGQTLDEATAEFVSDDCFESWYQETKAELEKLVK